MPQIRDSAARLTRKIKRRLNRYRRTLLRSVYARGRFRTRLVHGAVDPTSIPVIMALWSRPERAPAFLAELNAQDTDRPLRLMLWNNARTDTESYLRAAAALTAGSIGSVELRTSRANLGGITRFFMVAKLRRSGYRGPVVMFDDDQIVDDDFLAGLRSRYRPRSVSGVWAFAQHGSYWNRDELADGGSASYVGTGGCIVDSAVVELDGFWRLPDRFSFIEDQWMSYCARAAGWELRKAELPVDFVLQERNQNNHLNLRKEEFFRFLYDARPDLEPR